MHICLSDHLSLVSVYIHLRKHGQAHISLQMVAVTLEVGKMIEWKETNAQNTGRVATITGGSLNLTALWQRRSDLCCLGHDSRVTLKGDSVAVGS